jgi:NAD-reducing hydrogenase large subunit
MNRSITDVARQYVKGPDIREGMLNRVESAIRCYDPCLSCSTHAMGQMPLLIEVVDAEGKMVSEVRRG